MYFYFLRRLENFHDEMRSTTFLKHPKRWYGFIALLFTVAAAYYIFDHAILNDCVHHKGDYALVSFTQKC